MDLNNIWSEKYRPKKLSDLLINEDSRKILESFEKTKDIPHLLFCGPSGCGKTTLAKIIVKDILNGCDYLYINASDENGIDTIRHKVISFAQVQSFNGGVKVIILDEFDGSTNQNQRALRNVMEEYSANTRFILTANDKHNIITPIKSRCQTLDFDVDIKSILKRLLHILKSEFVTFKQEDLNSLIDLIRDNYPDIRKSINAVQRASISGEFVLKETNDDDQFVSDIVSMLTGDPIEIRKFILGNEIKFNSDYHGLLKNLLNYIYKTDSIKSKKSELIYVISEHMYKHTFVIDTEINVFACIIQLAKIVNS